MCNCAAYSRHLLILLLATVSPHLRAQTHDQWQLWITNVDGSGRKLLVDSPGHNCGSPDWSPDGRWVAYDTWPVASTNWDATQVAVVPSDGSKPPQLLGPGAMPSWSPDGTHIVCHTYDNPQCIVVMNRDGSGRETIVSHWGSPRWSPRGNRIASILNGNIALLDLATGHERTILSGPYRARQGFSISPDGLRFCFPGEDGGVYLATLDETTMQASVRTLVANWSCAHASWAPDGKRVVFSWESRNKLINAINSWGGLLTRTESLIVDSVMWRHQLYVLNVDSNDPPARLPGQSFLRNNVNPDWSPDGKAIVFASRRSQ